MPVGKQLPRLRMMADEAATILWNIESICHSTLRNTVEEEYSALLLRELNPLAPEFSFKF